MNGKDFSRDTVYKTHSHFGSGKSGSKILLLMNNLEILKVTLNCCIKLEDWNPSTRNVIAGVNLLNEVQPRDSHVNFDRLESPDTA